MDVEQLLKLLNMAFADEWLAYYQYWLGAKVVKGPMKEAVVAELLQHATDELRHADMVAGRIIQLGGTQFEFSVGCRSAPHRAVWLGLSATVLPKDRQKFRRHPESDRRENHRNQTRGKCLRWTSAHSRPRARQDRIVLALPDRTIPRRLPRSREIDRWHPPPDYGPDDRSSPTGGTLV